MHQLDVLDVMEGLLEIGQRFLWVVIAGMLLHDKPACSAATYMLLAQVLKKRVTNITDGSQQMTTLCLCSESTLSTIY